MTVSIDVDGAGPGEAAEQTRSLFGWLAEESELRGRVRLVDGAPVPGTLGSLPAELLVALAPGGAGTVLAGAVIAWVRRRTGEVTCTVTRPDGASATVRGRHVRNADTAALAELVRQVASALDATADPGAAVPPVDRPRHEAASRGTPEGGSHE